MSIRSEAQKAATDAYVILFELDCARIGGPVYRFVNGTIDGPISFGGHVYTPAPCHAEGFEYSGQGAPPNPKLSIGNVEGVITAIMIAVGSDLVGAKMTRVRTFKKHLDDGSDPDPEQHFPLDICRLERKSHEDDVYVEWELSPYYTYEGRMLPRRQVLRDYCTKTYRRWVGTGWDYSRAQCTYAGVESWDANGQPTAPENDRCGKRESDCVLRFGGDPLGLPTWACPGMQRLSK